jgi:hypothetical protein
MLCVPVLSIISTPKRKAKNEEVVLLGDGLLGHLLE